MTSLIQIVGAIQWVAGIALALLAIDRARRYGYSGLPPRALALAAIAIFVLALIVLLLAATPVSPLVAPLFPSDFTTPQWRHRTLFQSSLAGWVLLVASAVWNTVLGIQLRRRTAAAELRRRTDRALAYRTPQGGGGAP
jgi:cytochrome c oxidase assembly factor CtaG